MFLLLTRFHYWLDNITLVVMIGDYGKMMEMSCSYTCETLR